MFQKILVDKFVKKNSELWQFSVLDVSLSYLVGNSHKLAVSVKCCFTMRVISLHETLLVLYKNTKDLLTRHSLKLDSLKTSELPCWLTTGADYPEDHQPRSLSRDVCKIPVCLWGVLNLTRPALFICKTQFLPRARFLLFVPRPSRVTSFYLFLIKKSLFSLFFVYIRNNFSLAGSWEIEWELSIIFISWNCLHILTLKETLARDTGWTLTPLEAH